MSDNPIAVERHEPREFSGAYLLAVSHDEVRTPGLDDMRPEPLTGNVGGTDDVHGRYVTSPICPAMFSSARIRSPIGGWVSHSDFARSSKLLIGLTM